MKKIKELFTLFCAFFKIGACTFGGGYAMLPMLEREIVVKNKWATMEEIADYFAIGQCTPGVIAVNTATFIGYKKQGISGGIVATLGVVSPSVLIISVIASVLSGIYKNPVVQHAFKGVGVAVCAILIQAVIKIGKSGLSGWFTWVIAGVAFVLLLFFNVSPIIIIVIAGILGIAYKTIISRKYSNKKGDN